MAAVISISSDEGNSDEEKRPIKKLKLEKVISVICLDDDDDNKHQGNKINDDIAIESDEDVLCKSNEAKQSKITENLHNETKNSNITTKTINKCNESLNNHIPKSNNLNAIECENGISELFQNSNEMQIFINVCLSQLQNENTKSLFKSKITFCKKLFDKADIEYIQSESFRLFLEEKTELSKKNSISAVSSFNDVYQHLKSHINSRKIDNQIPNKTESIIAKLEHTLRKIQKVIAKLEVAEVDFDEEEDSTYIKLQRYKDRAVKIHEKICKYKREDAREFNHTINKKFKNNSVFPTYYDVERYLKKTVKEKNLNLSENSVKEEARHCFKKLGELLQQRRKVDLLSVHSEYLIMNSDPASEDPELESKLKTNYKEANSKINEICEKYAKLQESGEEPKLSSDSDDSKKDSTDNESDDE